MEEIFTDTQEQIDTFYKCCVGLMLKDYKEKGIKLDQAERLYKDWNIATIYKNGKVEFEEEKNKCDICGEYKDDVKHTIDPYIQEIYGESQYKNMCDKCYENAIYDI